MFNLSPIGTYHVQVCTTTPCWLRGSDAVMSACKAHLQVDLKQTTPDGLFTLSEVECLGACINAPMVQINDDYYEDLSPESMTTLLKDLATRAKEKA
jgi:NADH:ubiquinone oxidoreductase subunit E